MAQAATTFPNIGPEETLWRNMSFAPGLASDGSETITGTPTVTITVLSGTDATPQSRLVSGPLVVGPLVSVLLGTMIASTNYEIMIIVHTSKSQILSLSTQQQCLAD